MFNPLQPQFKIRILNGNKVKSETLKKTGVSVGSGYIDIESCCAYPVTYEESADLMTHLNFVVDKFADVLLYYFFIGQSIRLYGGYYADNQSGMRHIFSGTVTRIKTRFTDSGRISFSVECMNYGYTKMGKDFKNFVYPDKRSSRTFARKETLSLGEIIKGIAEENNFEIGEINLSTDARKVDFDKVNIRYQKDISDWKFLTKLAQDFGCSVWIENEDGVDKLYFVSHSKAFMKQSKGLSFLYPLNGDLTRITDVKDSEMQKFSNPEFNRPRILRSVTVDEDISQAYAVTRSAMYFDKATGEQKEAVSRIETKDGVNYMIFYELDEAKVEAIHRGNPKLADKIRSNGPAALPWGDPKNPNPECASYYYKEIRRYQEHQAVFDRAFYGITVSATCNQDLNIHSQRTYRIRGILSYHSKNLETSFFLRGLKHIWDSDGTWTELDFIR